MSLEGIKDFIVEQVEILLIIAFIVLIVITAYKRAWIAMIGVLLGFAFIGIFVADPDLILSLSEWLNNKINVGE